MLAKLHRKAVKRAAVQALQKPADDHPGAQVEPFDLIERFGGKL